MCSFIAVEDVVPLSVSHDYILRIEVTEIVSLHRLLLIFRLFHCELSSEIYFHS